MAERIIMPKQGLQMTAGLITKWLKAVGDSVREGEPLFEMETDKLAITIDSPASGTLLAILCPEGESAPVADVIAIVGEPGEDISGLATAPVTEAPKPAPAEPASVPEPEPAPAPAPAPVPPRADGRVFSTPRARMRAQERGIDLKKIRGTGPDGLIIERDVLEANLPEPAAARASLDVCRVEIDMSEAAALKETMAAQGAEIGYAAIVLRCAARALADAPLGTEGPLAISLNGDAGTAVPETADRLGLPRLDEIARQCSGDDEGAGLLILDMGELGVDEYIPASFRGPAALGLGTVRRRAIALTDGTVASRQTLCAALAYDPAQVCLADAAGFLARTKALLEAPALLMLAC